jgi:hypothetical protein
MEDSHEPTGDTPFSEESEYVPPQVIPTPKNPPWLANRNPEAEEEWLKLRKWVKTYVLFIHSIFLYFFLFFFMS